MFNFRVQLLILATLFLHTGLIQAALTKSSTDADYGTSAVRPLQRAFLKYPNRLQEILGLDPLKLTNEIKALKFRSAAQMQSEIVRSDSANCSVEDKEVFLFEQPGTDPSGEYFLFHEALCSLGYYDHDYGYTTMIIFMDRYDLEETSPVFDAFSEIAKKLRYKATSRLSIEVRGGTKIGGGGDRMNLQFKTDSLTNWLARNDGHIETSKTLRGLKILISTTIEKHIKTKIGLDIAALLSHGQAIPNGDETLYSPFASYQIYFDSAELPEAQRTSRLAKRFLAGPRGLQLHAFYFEPEYLEASMNEFMEVIEYLIDPGPLNREVFPQVDRSPSRSCIRLNIGENAKPVVLDYARRVLVGMNQPAATCGPILNSIRRANQRSSLDHGR